MWVAKKFCISSTPVPASELFLVFAVFAPGWE